MAKKRRTATPGKPSAAVVGGSLTRQSRGAKEKLRSVSALGALALANGRTNVLDEPGDLTFVEASPDADRLRDVRSVVEVKAADGSVDRLRHTRVARVDVADGDRGVCVVRQDEDAPIGRLEVHARHAVVACGPGSRSNPVDVDDLVRDDRDHAQVLDVAVQALLVERHLAVRIRPFRVGRPIHGAGAAARGDDVGSGARDARASTTAGASGLGRPISPPESDRDDHEDETDQVGRTREFGVRLLNDLGCLDDCVVRHQLAPPPAPTVLMKTSAIDAAAWSSCGMS